MKIKEMLSQSRRDFWAIYQCEHCGAEERMSGYDDDNFHRNVIPAMKCEKCGKTGEVPTGPIKTKYQSWEVV